jgi:hypothetical protein
MRIGQRFVFTLQQREVHAPATGGYVERKRRNRKKELDLLL